MTFPLEDYFKQQGKKTPPGFQIEEGYIRGHIATWEVLDGTLYLKKVETPFSRVEIALQSIFPEASGKAIKALGFQVPSICMRRDLRGWH